jgi:hypothetical protein
MASALALFELNTRSAPLRDVSAFYPAAARSGRAPSAIGCDQIYLWVQQTKVWGLGQAPKLGSMKATPSRWEFFAFAPCAP